MSSFLFANWTSTQEDNPISLPTVTVYSPTYGSSIRVSCDDESYLNQILLEYPVGHCTPIGSFTYTTAQRGDLSEGAVKAEVNPDKPAIAMEGVPHYGYFKSVFLGALAYFEELEHPNTISLHAALVEYQGKGILLSAPSGKGKTTYATMLVEQGGRLITDDWVIIREEGIGFRGDLTMRVSESDLERFARDPTKALFHPHDVKHELPLEWNSIRTAESARIAEIVFLNAEPTDRPGAYESLLRSSYHIPFNHPNAKISRRRLDTLTSLMKNARLNSILFEGGSVEEVSSKLRRIIHHEQ